MADIKVPESTPIQIGASFYGGGSGPVDAEGVRYTKPDEPDVDNVKEGLDAALERASAAFTQAGSGRAAIASALGTPATTEDTHAQLAGRIDASKATLAANLNGKGVNALSSEALAALAAKVVDIQAGGGFSHIEILSITASGTVTFPVGTVMIDFALIGGGASPSSSGHYGVGAGAGIQRRFGIDVSGTPSAPITIAAAQGNTTFLGVTALGTSQTSLPSYGTAQPTTATLLWGTWGQRVGGSAGIGSEANVRSVGEFEGGGAVNGSSASVPPRPNTGGGGMQRAIGAGGNISGATGYAEIICYIKD